MQAMSFDDFFQRVVKTTGISTQKELAKLLSIDPAAITQAKTRGVPKLWGVDLVRQIRGQSRVAEFRARLHAHARHWQRTDYS